MSISWRFLLPSCFESCRPNLITLLGFFFISAAFFVTMRYSPDLASPLPAWVCALNALCIYVYQTLDALDGKQARRTRSSSPLGELFDHGCDAMTTVVRRIFFPPRRQSC